MRSLFARLFSDRSYTVKTASTLLAVAALLSNVLGLLRNIVFVNLIPLNQLDVYYASFRIPDFLLNLIIFGAVSNAFVPIVTELITHKKQDEAWKVTDQLLSWLSVAFIALGVILWLLMPVLMQGIAGGFDPARTHSAVLLSRLMLIQPLFFAWSFTVGGLLNSTRRFSSFALAPLLYNAMLIMGGIAAHRYGIIAITYAVIIGSFFHFFIQFLELRRTGYRFTLDLRLTKQVKEIFTLMVPRSLSQGMAQLVLIVYTALASHLAEGSITIFSNMNDLQTTPTVIVANSLAVAFFPSLSAYIAQADWEGMNALLTKVVRTTLFILLPTIVLAFILRAQAVRLYFGFGGHSWDDTIRAMQTFSWFLLGIIPGSLVILLARVFYSFKNTWTPMYVSIFAGLVSMIIAFAGIQAFGGDVATLALADSILALVQCSLYIYILNRHKHIRFNLASLFSHTLSYVFGSLLVGLVTWAVLQLIDRVYQSIPSVNQHAVVELVVQLVLGGLIGIGVYLGYSRVAHKEELQWLRKRRFTNSR